MDLKEFGDINTVLYWCRTHKEREVGQEVTKVTKAVL